MLRELNKLSEQLELENYSINNIIGSGGYSMVFKANDKKTNDIVAIKIFTYDFLRKKDRINLMNELMLLCFLNIPGIVKHYGYRFPLTIDEIENTGKILKVQYTDKNNAVKSIDSTGYIVFMESMKYGCIFDHIKNYIKSEGKSDIINPTVHSKLIFGVAATMKRLHKLNIIHRDLKLYEIYLDDRLEAKIGGFGLSTYYSKDKQLDMAIGTPLSMAPELFTDEYETYDFKVDVYAFAFLILQMFSNDIKFKDFPKIRSPQQYMRKISEGKRPERPDSIPSPYWELIEKCWKQIPSERPTFDEITEILKDDKFAIEEFGLKTDLIQLHQYQQKMDVF